MPEARLDERDLSVPAQGARIAVQGSRIEDRGSGIEDPGSRAEARGAGSVARGAPAGAAQSSAALAPQRGGIGSAAAHLGAAAQSSILDPLAATDQAATLRRLFAPPQARVLPVLMPERHCTVRSSWVAKLAQALARSGERTLVVDAARAQVAAALGLRARFDLAQAWLGDCEPAAARVDAGPALGILPAARALQQAQARGASLLSALSDVGAALAWRGGCDLLLLLLPASAAAREVAGDLLVPTLPAAADLQQTLREIEQVAGAMRRIFETDSAHPLRAAAEARATPTFRLLFLGMDARAAATLVHRLSFGLRAPTALAGAVQIARDLAPIAQAVGGWPLARLAITRRAAR